MEKIILYTNDEYALLEFQRIEETKSNLIKIREFLLNQDIETTPVSIVDATRGQFALNKYRETERQKALKAIEAFGDSVITEGWEKRVEDKVERYRSELERSLPKFPLENREYIQYFDLSDSVKLKHGIDYNYFIEKHSVILSSPDQIAFYEKHVQALHLLNELIQHPQNEYKALQRLFYFNSDTKEFELNIQTYDENHEKFNLMENYNKKLATEESNRAFKERNNQQRLKMGLPPL